jgi:hypothetical protein
VRTGIGSSGTWAIDPHSLVSQQTNFAPRAVPRDDVGGYRAGVNAEDLSPEKLERLKEIVSRQLRFYVKLTQRMNQMGWDPQDEILLAAWEAHHALHSLSVKLHYASCPKGTTGR